MNNEEISKEIEEVLNSIESDLIKGNKPKEIEIEYILEKSGQNILTKEQADKFSKMINQINEISKQDKNNKSLSVKRESFFKKIPFIKNILQWYENKKLSSQEIYNKESVTSSTDTSLKKRKQFKEDLYQKTFDESNNVISKPEKEEIIVISDLHSRIDRFEFVKEYLKNNPKSKFIILGDATDRGEYGIELLMQIKELSDRGRVEYLPGNHDIFAYNYVKSKASNDSSIYKEAKWCLEHNGGLKTMEKLDNFENTVNNARRNGIIQQDVTLDEMMNWLGTRRIQMTINQNNINYALAHAVFDAKLYTYDAEFSLEKAYNMTKEGNNKEIIDRFKNCMWYRKKEEKTHYAEIIEIENYVMVVGHTSQEDIKLDTIGKKEQMPIICVDTGKANGLEGFSLTTGCNIKLEEKEKESER